MHVHVDRFLDTATCTCASISTYYSARQYWTHSLLSTLISLYILQANWAVNLGEHAIDIKVVSAPGGPTQLLVLGERSVFCFKDSGVLRFMKKLDFNPTCIQAYRVLPQPAPSTDTDSSASPGHGCGEIQYLLSSDSHQLFVFRDSTLIWAASLDYAPVDMTIASFQ